MAERIILPAQPPRAERESPTQTIIGPEAHKSVESISPGDWLVLELVGDQSSTALAYIPRNNENVMVIDTNTALGHILLDPKTDLNGIITYKSVSRDGRHTLERQVRVLRKLTNTPHIT